MQFNLKINGTDFSPAFNSIGYGVSYLKIEGDNGGTTLDGTLVEDVLAWKAVVNLPCIDLEEDMLSSLLTACMADSLSVEYYDLKTKKIRSIDASITMGEATFLLQDCDGVRVYTVFAISLREK